MSSAWPFVIRTRRRRLSLIRLPDGSLGPSCDVLPPDLLPPGPEQLVSWWEVPQSPTPLPSCSGSTDTLREQERDVHRDERGGVQIFFTYKEQISQHFANKWSKNKTCFIRRQLCFFVYFLWKENCVVLFPYLVSWRGRNLQLNNKCLKWQPHWQNNTSSNKQLRSFCGQVSSISTVTSAQCGCCGRMLFTHSPPLYFWI